MTLLMWRVGSGGGGGGGGGELGLGLEGPDV